MEPDKGLNPIMLKSWHEPESTVGHLTMPTQVPPQVCPLNSVSTPLPLWGLTPLWPDSLLLRGQLSLKSSALSPSFLPISFLSYWKIEPRPILTLRSQTFQRVRMQCDFVLDFVNLHLGFPQPSLWIALVGFGLPGTAHIHRLVHPEARKASSPTTVPDIVKGHHDSLRVQPILFPCQTFPFSLLPWGLIPGAHPNAFLTWFHFRAYFLRIPTSSIP